MVRTHLNENAVGESLVVHSVDVQKKTVAENEASVVELVVPSDSSVASLLFVDVVASVRPTSVVVLYDGVSQTSGVVAVDVADMVAVAGMVAVAAGMPFGGQCEERIC